MSINRVSACVFAVATSLAGCVAAATGDAEYGGEVHVTSTELVELPSGVQVVADADEPLFYSDGFYWVHRDGRWMRSSTYRGGFVSVDRDYVPERVRMISHPQSYAQYRRHHGRTLEARATPEPQPRSNRHPPGGPMPPPSSTYVPERGLPPEPDTPPDREAPEPPRVPVAPADERDRVPPQSPQQRGPLARPEDRNEVEQTGDRNQERGLRSPIRSEDEPGHTSPRAEQRNREADEKQDTKAPDE